MIRTRLLAFALVPALALAGCGKKDAAPTSDSALAKVSAPAGKTWADVVETTDDGFRMGNPEAPLKLVEYGSLTCPHCAKLAEEGMASLRDTYVGSGRVSYEYRSFTIHGPDLPLTLLVQCADKTAAFPLIEQLYANQQALIERAQQGEAQAQAAMKLPDNQRMQAMSDAMGFTEFFAQRGLPKAQADKCLADPAAAKKVADNAQKWGNSGIDSTPTLFLNDQKLPGSTWAEIEASLKAAGAR